MTDPSLLHFEAKNRMGALLATRLLRAGKEVPLPIIRTFEKLGYVVVVCEGCDRPFYANVSGVANIHYCTSRCEWASGE